MNTYKIAAIGADGIGPEVIGAIAGSSSAAIPARSDVHE